MTSKIVPPAEAAPSPRKTVRKKAAPAPAPAPAAAAADVAEPAAPVEAAAALPADGADKAKGKKKDKRKKHKKNKKEAVIIRFDDEQLPLIDSRAEALGLSRAAWVRMVVARALAE